MERSTRDDLKRWMIRLADGDRAAFDPVYKTVRPIIHSFAKRSLSSASDADDVAQQALLNVFARAGEFDAQRDALPWILGITAYEVRTHRNKVARRREDFASGECETTTSQEDAIIARDLESAALEVLGTLRAEDIETIITATHDGRRPAISAASFRKRLQRAVTRLRHAWKERHGTE